MFEIRQEVISEQKETETVVREAFWNVYSPGCSEHYLIHQLRHCPAFIPQLNLVATENGVVIGHVANIQSHIAGDDGNRYPIVCLGPLSVLPQHQKNGIGTALISQVKKRARDLGYAAILLYGNPAFYLKQGFEPAEKYGIRNSENMFATALHACELYDGSLRGKQGKYYEDDIYHVDDQAVQAFDRHFPSKEMISGTPSQKLFLEISADCKPFIPPQRTASVK